MHDKLKCGCKEKCTCTHLHVQVDADNTSEKMEQTGTWVHQVAQAMEETRNKKKKAQDAKRIRGIVHENDKSKGTRHLPGEMGTPRWKGIAQLVGRLALG